MKLKNYIIIGYLISTILTILAVFWAVQKMLIEKSEIYFLIGVTLFASFFGAMISLLLLSPIFSSLNELKKKAKDIANKNFNTSITIKGPIEFQEFGKAFTHMSDDLKKSFDSLEESEKENEVQTTKSLYRRADSTT